MEEAIGSSLVQIRLSFFLTTARVVYIVRSAVLGSGILIEFFEGDRFEFAT